MVEVKRFLSGFCAFSLLVLIGLQAAHAHPVSAPESCNVCALAGGAARHVASAAPKPALIQTTAAVAPTTPAARAFLRFIDTAPRAPPSVA